MLTHAMVHESVGWGAVNPGAGNTVSLTAVDAPNAIRFTNDRVFIESAWARTQFAADIQIHSPNMANDITAQKFLTSAGGLTYGWPDPLLQEVNKQDVITVQIVNCADAAGDIELAVTQNLYRSFGTTGNGRYITRDECVAAMVNVQTMRFTKAGLATAVPAYIGTTAFSAQTTAALRNNTDYAILGFTFIPAAGKCAAISFFGPSTGNYRYGGPAFSQTENGGIDTRNYFVNRSDRLKIPCINVFNSADIAGQFVTFFGDENFTGGELAVFIAELT